MKTIIDILQSFDSPLKAREAQILQLRFGLGTIRELPSPKGTLTHEGVPIGSNGHSLEEVGAIAGISGEYARRILASALRKIQHPARFRPLLNFLKETPPSADAAVLIRAVYPDKAKFLRSNHGPDFKEGEQAAFANKVIQLCYGDENAEQSKDHPKPPGAPRKRRSLLENSRS